MNQPKTSPMDGVLALLDLKALADLNFEGISPPGRQQRIFGGQVLAQALIAASRTVENLHCHSLHAYFLRAGDPTVPLLYRVEKTRDGASFTARRVVAIQHDLPIFIMACSFQRFEHGFEHQFDMPGVPDPETLEDEYSLREKEIDSLPEEMRDWLMRPRAIEIRPVAPRPFLERGRHPPFDNVWLRAGAKLSDDPALHQAVLAYASDMTLLDTSLLPHGTDIFANSLQVASLDHAMWFHRPFRADDWLLYAQDSPSASATRGFNRGEIFSRDGKLVASVTQEGLIRPRSKKLRTPSA